MSKKRGEVGVEFQGGKGNELTITLRGEATTVCAVLVNGMPRAALEYLLCELNAVIAKRKQRAKKGRT